MTDTGKKLLKLAIRLLGTAALLAWVLSKIELSQILANFGLIRFRYVLLAWFVMMVMWWLRAVKMKQILDMQGCPLATSKVFAASAVTALYSLVLPGFIGSAVKWYIIRSHTGKGHKILSSMIYNQLSDIVTLTAIGLIALMITNPGNHPYLPCVCGALLLAVVVGSVLLLSHRFGAKVTRVARYALKPFPAVVRSKGVEVLDQVSLFQTVQWGFHFKMLGLTLIRVGLRVWLYVAAAKVAQIDIPLLTITWVVALVFILGRLPISVANLGVREAALVQSLAMYGVEGSQALVMSTVIFSCILLMAAVGAVYQLKGPLGTRKEIFEKAAGLDH